MTGMACRKMPSARRHPGVEGRCCIAASSEIPGARRHPDTNINTRGNNRWERRFATHANFLHLLRDNDERANIKEFLQEFGEDVIQGKGKKGKQLSAEQYQERFKKMNPNRAAPADGWKVKEVRLLPRRMIQGGADLNAKAEEGKGKWPEVMRLGVTTLLKKTQGDPKLLIISAGRRAGGCVPCCRVEKWAKENKFQHEYYCTNTNDADESNQPELH